MHQPIKNPIKFNRTFIIYACDLTENGRELGPSTILRLKTALTSLTGNVNTAIIMTAGKSKKPRQPKTMAAMMQDWLVTRKIASHRIFIPDEETGATIWGTFEETRAALDILCENNLPDRITIVSSDSHLERIRFIFESLTKGAIAAIYRGTGEEITPRERRFEKIKMLKARVLIFLVRLLERILQKKLETESARC